MKRNVFTQTLIEGLHLLVTTALLGGLALSLTPVPIARAATFDIPNGDVVALVNAIDTANGNAEPDVINLAAGGTYTLTAADNNTDGPNGLPSITSEITINGNGATIQRSSIGGTPEFRIFHVGAGGDLTLNDVTVRQGKTPKGPDGSDGSDGGDAPNGGGGIFNAGTATLNGATVKDNTTGAGGKGGDSTTGNGGDGGNGAPGGGIYNAGSLTLSSSTVKDNGTGAGGAGGDSAVPNTAGNGGDGGSGGGIYNDAGDTVVVLDGTVTGNSAGSGGSGGTGRYGRGGNGGNGGGICNGGQMELTDSTLSGNAAGSGGAGGEGSNGDGGDGGNGGGICNNTGGTVDMAGSTVTLNDAGSGGQGGNGGGSGDEGGRGGSGGSGGGIHNSGTATLISSSVDYNDAGVGGYGGDGDFGGSGGDGGSGGGIYNSGVLVLSSSTIEANRTRNGASGGQGVQDAASGSGGDGGSGGGIANKDGRVVLTNSAVSQNSTGNGGLGMDSGFYTGGYGGDGGHGGGIHSIGATAQLTLTKSTVNDNSTGNGNVGGSGGTSQEYGNGGNGGDGGHGGGIHNGDATAHLTNSTISGNSAGDGQVGGSGGALSDGEDGDGGHGGGVYNTGGTVKLTHCTVTDNDTGEGGSPGSDGSGGGLGSGGLATSTLRSTILAGNSAAGSGPDCSGDTTSEDYNLVGDGSGCAFPVEAHDQVGSGGSPIDPQLDSLALNAPGDTRTHALLAGSPALDHVPDGANGCGIDIADDQRSVGRPQAGGCDIGAFEDAERGTIILEKQTNPAGTPGTFDFTHDIEPPYGFGLTHGDKETFYVWPRTYSVTEADPGTDFALSEIVCSDEDSSGDVTTGAATVRLQSGETVTCTFTNTERGALVIEKRTDPPGGSGFGFSFISLPCEGDCEGLWFTLDDGERKTFREPGTYLVTEQVAPGSYGLGELTCVEDTTSNSTADLGNREATVILDPGEVVTCTFVNTLQAGTIIVEKEIDGGVCSGSYTFEIPNLPRGSYSVTEDSPTMGAELTAIACDDGGSATPSTWDVESKTAVFELDPGEKATCSFTNRLLVAVTGGAVLPPGRLALLAPWLGLGALVSLGAIGVVMVRRRGG